MSLPVVPNRRDLAAAARVVMEDLQLTPANVRRLEVGEWHQVIESIWNLAIAARIRATYDSPPVKRAKKFNPETVVPPWAQPRT